MAYVAVCLGFGVRRDGSPHDASERAAATSFGFRPEPARERRGVFGGSRPRSRRRPSAESETRALGVLEGGGAPGRGERSAAAARAKPTEIFWRRRTAAPPIIRSVGSERVYSYTAIHTRSVTIILSSIRSLTSFGPNTVYTVRDAERL